MKIYLATILTIIAACQCYSVWYTASHQAMIDYADTLKGVALYERDQADQRKELIQAEHEKVQQQLKAMEAAARK